MRKNSCLSWYAWQVADSVDPAMWTAYRVGVYPPTIERPYVSVLYQMANGGGRCFARYLSLDTLRRDHTIPEMGIERLERAFTQGQELLEAIQRDVRLLAHAHGGSRLVNVDTGEIVSDAERIVRGSL